MIDHPGWYPTGKVCNPPELPVSFRKVYDLKPVAGVPRDEEVIGIHTVIHAANRVSGVPEMHDPDLYMKLADHLFNVQMARYRSRYSLIIFPSDATYTPPTLPSHVSISLQPVSGAPSNDEIKKVHDAMQMYQELRRFPSLVPSLFDANVNMELSQHLFDIQDGYMQQAGESSPNPAPPVISTHEARTRAEEPLPDTTGETSRATNNAGNGADAVEVPRTPPVKSSVGVSELMERSNQLAERFNQLLDQMLERSSEQAERGSQPSEETRSHTFSEKLNQVLERLAHAVERSHPPAEQSSRLDERFNQLLERFNQLFEQSYQPAHRANELAERSNEIMDRGNQLAEKLHQLHARSNELSKQANTNSEKVGDFLESINRMLMRIQHAIVRNHRGNTINSLDCLANEKGEMPLTSIRLGRSFRELSESWYGTADFHLPVVIDGAVLDVYVPDIFLGNFLQVYGIGDGLCRSASSHVLQDGKAAYARRRLANYLSSCLG